MDRPEILHESVLMFRQPVLAILKQAEEGVPVAELCREHGMGRARICREPELNLRIYSMVRLRLSRNNGQNGAE